MLKENEKRIFWIIVMAIAAVSLVTAWVSGFVVGIDNMIYNTDAIGLYPDVDFGFSTSVLLLCLLVIVAAAVTHVCTKGRHCMKAKIIWAAVIGGYFLLSSIVFAIVFHAASIGDYAELIEYVTATFAIAVSYEIAFLAQCMLDRRDKSEKQPHSEC